MRRPRSTLPRKPCAKRIPGIGQRRRSAPGRHWNLQEDRDVEYAAAFALALSGESSESQKLAGNLEKRFPEDTPVQFEYLPTLHALSALAHQAPSDAVERLQRAVPYDFAMPGTAFFGKFGGSLSRIYTRRGVPGSRTWPRGRGGISKSPRSPRPRFGRSHRRSGALATGQSLRCFGRHDQGQKRLSGFSHPLERCRPGHSRSQTGQSRIREAIVIPHLHLELCGKRRLAARELTTLCLDCRKLSGRNPCKNAGWIKVGQCLARQSG